MLFAFTLPGCSKSYLHYTATQEYKHPEIKWQKYSSTTLVVSRTSKRPMFIYFTTENCTHCEKFELALKDPEVAYFIMNAFVPVMVDADLVLDEVLGDFEIEGFPTIVVLSSFNDNEMIFKHLGGLDSESLLDLLRMTRAFNTLMDPNVED